MLTDMLSAYKKHSMDPQPNQIQLNWSEAEHHSVAVFPCFDDTAAPDYLIDCLTEVTIAVMADETDGTCDTVALSIFVNILLCYL